MSDLCNSCGKVVYQMEKLVAKDKSFHKGCFRCATCGVPLTLASVFLIDGKLRCKQHMKDTAAAPSPAAAAPKPAPTPTPTPTPAPTPSPSSIKPAPSAALKPAPSSALKPAPSSASPKPAPSSASPKLAPSAAPTPAPSKPAPSSAPSKPAPTVATPAKPAAAIVKQATSRAPISTQSSSEAVDPKAAAQKEAEWAVSRPERPEWASLLRKAESEYEHPSANAQIPPNVISRVLAGDMGALDSVPPPQKWVRIFISSTFTDTEKERNLLMEDVFPYLNVMCKKLGLEFGTIDMRWGVREFTADNHGTSALCMKELRKCLDSSIGPAFVCLLGDKYGYRPFPSEILRTEMEPMWTHIKKVELAKISPTNPDLASRIDKRELHELWDALSDADKKEVQEKSDLLLVPQWYKLDENVEPDVYVLLNVSAILPNYISDNKELRQADSNKWWAIFEKLQVLLKEGSKALQNEQDRRKYTIAVTHEEVSIGLLDNENRDKQCFCYLRQIEDVTDEPDRNFIDTAWINGKSEVLQETRDMLNKLKEEEVTVLHKDNIKSISVKKAEVGLEKEQRKESEMYYRRTFCDDFAKRICDSVFEGYKKIPKTDHPIYPEAVQHLLFQQEKLRFYVDRSRVQMNITRYLDDNSSQSSKMPFIVHARSGAGKTALMAWAANHASTKYQNAVVVTRFIGVTSTASEIITLLVSVCNQLAEIYSVVDKKKVLLKENLDDITKFLQSEIFQAASKSTRPLFLFLDSLDQLLPLNNALLLNWLPLTLPPKVHLVVSTITDKKEGGLFDRVKDIFSGMLQDKARIAEDNFYQVPLLEVSEGESILKLWLGQRTLTSEQQKAVLQGFEKCATPLYLRLATDIAFHWKSYTPASECFLGVDVKEIINTFFAKLEKIHGLTLVQHAMGYLSASRYGLSYADLEDLLSCDDEVLDEVYHFWTPPIRRLSPLLWSRLRDDIGSYLTERGVHEVTVYNWYHRQFWEVARARYLDEETKPKRHETMAMYFEGRYSSPNCLMHKDKKTGKQEMQDRLILQQPLKFSGSIFNRHRLTELPYHQTFSNDPYLYDSTLYNFEFIEVKIDAGMHAELLLDYDIAIEHFTKILEDEDRKDLEFHIKSLKEYLSFVHAHMYVLRKSPHQTLMFALNQPESLQLTNDAKEKKAKLIRTLFLMRNKPLPMNPCITTIEAGHGGVVTDCVPSPDGKLLLSGSSKGLHLWDLATGADKGSFAGHTKKVDCCCFSPDGSKVASASWDTTVKIWDIHSRTCIFTFTGHKKAVYHCAFSPDGTTVASCGIDMCVKLWNVSDGTVLFSWETEGYETVCFSPDGKLLASGGENEEVAIWYTKTGKVQRMIPLPDGIYNLCFSSDGSLLAGTTGWKKVMIWDTEEGNVNATLEGHKDSVTGCSFSPDGSLLASCSNDHTVKIWNPYDGECQSTLAGHSDYVRRCHFTHDGKYLVTASDDGFIKVWNPFVKGNAKDFHHSNQITCIEFSPDGKRVVTTSYDHSIVMWDAETDKPLYTISEHKKDTLCACFYPDSKKFITTSADKSIRIWETSTGKNLHVIPDAHHYEVATVKMSRNGKEFATTCILLEEEPKDHVRIWDSTTYKLLHTLSDHTDGAVGCDYSPDGSLFASGSFDKTIIVYDAKTYKPLKVLKGHTKRIDMLAFSQDNAFIISGSADFSVRVWDVKKGQQILCHMHQDQVDSVFTSGPFAYTHCKSQIVMWNMQSWRIEKVFHLLEDFTKLNIRDNKFLVCGTSEGDVQFFDVVLNM